MGKCRYYEFLLPSAERFQVSLFFSARRTDIADTIEINGSQDFLLRTKEALILLRPTAFYDEIKRHVSVIKEGSRSGMRANAKRPTFVVGKPTWSHSALWYAGAIAQDAYHSRLYRDAKASTGKTPPADCWTGSEAEKQCMAFQLQVLQELKADENMIAYVRGCAKQPAYQGRHRGWMAWWDYLRRWW